MSGDWIKMRTSLLTHPKVGGIARFLSRRPDTARALSVGHDGVMADIVSRDVMRYVTVASLLLLWGDANEHTKDGLFSNTDLQDIDEKVGIPGFGEAMEHVGWLEYDAENEIVTLCNFSEWNTTGRSRGGQAKTGAERQKEYRDRKKAAAVTKSDVTRNGKSDVTSDHREEKRREERTEADASVSSPSSAEPPGFARFWQAWPKSERKTAKAECRKRWKQRGLEAMADTIVAHVTAMAGTPKWCDGFEPAPLTYLNQRHWEDGLPDVGYTPEQAAVFEAYNSVLGAKEWPAASMEPFSPERAAAISQFLTFNDKPDWIRRYFDYLAENLDARPGYGLDWTLRRDIYLRAREGNFSSGSHE